MSIKLVTIIILFPIGLTFSQVPNTDLWLLDFKDENNAITLSKPKNITNRNGYDNQPTFSPDGTYLLYTSIHEQNQSDIYKYDLTNEKITQITNTPTSEYSPTFMPDDKNISVVMVEQDSTQRIWYLPIKGNIPQLLISDTDSIGYHTWVNKENAYIFLLPEPFKLFLINNKTGKQIFIDDSIGRCFKMYGNMLIYLKKFSNQKNELYFHRISDNKIWSSKTFISGEDFTIYKDIILWTDGPKIYATKISKNDQQLIVDLSNQGIKKITRITLGPFKNKLAIAAEQHAN